MNGVSGSTNKSGQTSKNWTEVVNNLGHKPGGPAAKIAYNLAQLHAVNKSSSVAYVTPGINKQFLLEREAEGGGY